MECPLCGLNNSVFTFAPSNVHGRHIINRDEKFVLYECLNCHTYFLDNSFIDSNYYEKYYPADYYDNDKQNKKAFINQILFHLDDYSRKKKKQFILFFFKNCKRKLAILDIGCAKGDFLASLDKNIFDRAGVEINREGARLSLGKGLEVYNQDINEIDFGGKKFDIITMWHVLEHLSNPLKLFHKIYEILTNSGILLFQVPNSYSPGFRYGKENWFHLDAPRHLILYNKKNMDFLCKKAGFKIVKIKNEFYDYPLDLFWSLRKSAIRFLVYPLYPLIKVFCREHLTFICQKIDIP